MTIRSTIVGTAVGPRAHEIDARWLMAFAARLGETAPEYLDTRRPGGFLAHPLFPVCYEWPLAVEIRAGLPGEVAARAVRHGVWMITSLALKDRKWGVVVSRSTDGLTWGAPAVVSSSPSGSYDKPWTACDNWPGSPFYGNCYATWDEVGTGHRIAFSTSTDGGLTWNPKTIPPGSPPGLGGIPLPQPDGGVVVPAVDPFAGQIIAVKSDDGGLTWSEAWTVANILAHRVAGGLRAPRSPRPAWMPPVSSTWLGPTAAFA